MKHRAFLLLLFLLLLATAGIARRRPVSKRTKPVASAKSIDSLALRRDAIAFIKSVKGYALAASQFKLENQPASLEYMGCLQGVAADQQTFTAAERNLIKEAAKHKVARWSAADFAGTLLLDSDTVNAIFKDRHKGWFYFHEHIGPDFNSFSFPIFIRKGTYCLFYTADYCGDLCAEGSLVLYKKSGTKWTKVKAYCEWVS